VGQKGQWYRYEELLTVWITSASHDWLRCNNSEGGAYSRSRRRSSPLGTAIHDAMAIRRDLDNHGRGPK
jgi:hypothetical protein